jgi:23S rRNA pseudouridine1911/1915/1917 synthase
MIGQRCVTVNGAECDSIAREVTAGDLVSICFDPSQRYKEERKRWDDRTFTIVHEDEYLIVVDKAAGTLTVPTDNQEPNTLAERVSVYLSHARGKREAFVVHRLDREVSGLLVFAKQEAVAQQLVEQFKQHKPIRVYTAIVAGSPKQDEGTFRSHLATAKNLNRYSTRPGGETELAVTHYRVLRRMADTSLIEVRLETGKRHQIRLHFAEAGHPVLGDPRYKKGLASHPRWIRKRIALHATTLGFVHPVSGTPMSYESPLPAAMQRFLAGRR